MTKSALTPEEWADFLQALRDPDHWDAIEKKYHRKQAIRSWGTECGEEHGEAAMSLYGQPFGFTRGDVKILRDHARYFKVRADEGKITEWRWMHDLADRIEALLPPEDE